MYAALSSFRTDMYDLAALAIAAACFAFIFVLLYALEKV